MEEKILEHAVSSFIKELFNEGKLICGDIESESKQLFKKDIEKYLNNQKNRYSHLKTLLKGNSPVYIYDIYFNINIFKIKSRQKNKHHGSCKIPFHVDTSMMIDTSNVNNLFKDSNNITIIGDAGSGKSTLIKHLFINSIANKYAIPVLIELRYLNLTERALFDYICDKILDNKISQNEKILNRLLEKGNFIFFLDGYDELSSTKKSLISEEINSIPVKFPKNKYILTTRPYSDIEQLESFHNYNIAQLGKDDINKFVDLQLKDEDELAEKIKLSLKNNRSRFVKSFLSNPLLLSLYILTFQSNASIPDKKYIFYRRVINALFSEHDSKTKLGFVREKLSGINQEELEKLLRAFCFLSFFENKYSFDYDYINSSFDKLKPKILNKSFDNNQIIHDLKSAISLWIEDNGLYSFAHKSLQEYFAASFIKNLNDNDKKRTYIKIIDKFSERSKSFNEIENFLSLCEEIDELNFSKYYTMPLLDEVYAVVNYDDDILLTKSFLRFFCVGINNTGNKAIGIISVNPIVYKTIYIHISYTQLLYSTISSNARKIICKNKNNPIDSVYFKGEMPENIQSLLCDSETINIAKTFKKYIEEKKIKTKIFIEQSINNDKDFVDMI